MSNEELDMISEMSPNNDSENESSNEDQNSDNDSNHTSDSEKTTMSDLCNKYEVAVDQGDYQRAQEILEDLTDNHSVDSYDLEELFTEEYRFPEDASDLHIAAITGNVEKVIEILKNSPKETIETTGEEDENPYNKIIPEKPIAGIPLHFAAFHGHLEIIQLLIKFAPKLLTLEDGYGRTALDFAYQQKHQEIVTYLIEQLETSFYLNQQDCTLYHIAVKNRDINLLKKLVKTDIKRTKVNDFNISWLALSINRQDSHGKTAFHIACENGNAEAVQVLLEHPDIDINIEDHNGLTPTTYAIRNKFVKILQLIQKKVEANKKIIDSGYKKTFQKTKDEISDDDYNSDPYINDTIKDTIVEVTLEDTGFDSEDNDKNEGKTYLQEAVDSDRPQVLLEVLRFTGLKLDERDNEKKLRAISMARAKMSVELSKEQRRELKRLENVITANLRRRNLSQMKAKLSEYCTDDLRILLELSKAKLNDKSLLEGFINFSVHIELGKEKKKTKPITSLQVVETINNIIEEREKKEEEYPTKDPVITGPAYHYILLKSAHSLFDDANRTSGEELDSETEIDLETHRKAKWEQELYHESAQTSDDVMETDETYIPIFRGINFMRDLFEYEDRVSYEKSADQKKFFASHGCYALLGKEPFDPTVSEEELEEKAEQIRSLIKQLENPETVKLFEGNKKSKKALRQCKSLLKRLQLLYTENIDGFNYDVFANISKEKSLKDKILKKFPWFIDIFQKNPFVSGSIIPMHSVRYALGVSRANANTELLLDPRYDSEGKPKYASVGMVFIALYPKKEYQNLEAINIPKAFAAGEFMLKGYLMLLPEAEVTIAGLMKHVVISMPILFPDFSKASKNEMMQQFNLSEGLYEEISTGIRKKRGSIEYRAAIAKLKDKLIDYYDAKLLSIAKNHAKLKGGKLEFELPDGTFTSTPPTPDEIRVKAELLSPLVKEKRKTEVRDQLKKRKEKEKENTKKKTTTQKRKATTEIDDTHIKKQKKDMAQSASKFGIFSPTAQVFLGYISYNQNIYFKAIPNNGVDLQGRSGSCGYLSLGTTREALIQSLLNNLRNNKMREYIGDQIQNDFQDPTAKTYLNLSYENNLKLSQFMELYHSAQAYRNRVIRESNLRAKLTDPNEDQLISYFNNNDDENVKKLIKAKIKLADAQRELIQFLQSEDLVKDYINQNLKTEWLGAYIALAWAQVNNKQVCIWTHQEGETEGLFIREKNNTVNPDEIIDILHTNNHSHYVRLQPITKNVYHLLKNKTLGPTSAKQSTTFSKNRE